MTGMIGTTSEPTKQSAAYFARIGTVIGRLLLVGERTQSGLAVLGIYYDHARHAVGAVPEGAHENPRTFADVQDQLDAYLRGTRRSFELVLAPRGTDFQRRVWRELSTIPYGTTATYAEIAERIGAPGAARAVGAANGQNPLSIVVPCHRVIGAKGALTGYAGGIPAKLRLLEIERSAQSASG
jgi:methylated-DNA-[protein]-cysteine S-methyltransferase